MPYIARFFSCLFFCVLVVAAPLPAQAAAPQKAEPAPSAAAAKPEDKAPPITPETYRLLKLFADVFERTRAQYVEPVKDEDLVEAALNGMLMHLDPHSGYMSQNDFRDMQVQTRGQFGGLGIEVTMENGAVKVVAPIDDTPAQRAGMQSGDLIITVDGQPVMGMSLQDAVNKMRGPVGTDIKLMVVRGGKGEPFEVVLTRAVIKVQSVKHRTSGNIGIVRISSFTDLTQDGLDKALTDIKNQLGDKLEGLVLDLRNNPGGLLEQAVSVSDTFLDKGEIVFTRAREEKDNMKFAAQAGDAINGKPMVVLINAGSASAAEIVAGALQDNRRALVIGLKSFGKGSVQTISPIPGYGAIRLTTARYYTPSGRSIQAEGIEPDIIVEQAKLEKIKGNGLEIHEADLKGALANDTKEKEEPAPEATPQAANYNTKDAKEEEEDYQLARAVDLIHGLSLYSSGAPVKPDVKPAAKTSEQP